MRDRLRRAESRAERESLIIPQKDGPPAKFPKSAVAEIFLHNMRRLAGSDIEPHPVSQAIANSPEPDRFAGTFLDTEHAVVDQEGKPIDDGIEDLSE